MQCEACARCREACVGPSWLQCAQCSQSKVRLSRPQMGASVSMLTHSHRSWGVTAVSPLLSPQKLGTLRPR